MKKSLWVFCWTVILTGCSSELTPTKMALSIKECEDNNLTYEIVRSVNAFHKGNVIKIRCVL